MPGRIFESQIQTGYTNSKCHQNESQTYNVLKTYVNHARLYIRIKIQMNQEHIYSCDSREYVLAIYVNHAWSYIRNKNTNMIPNSTSNQKESEASINPELSAGRPL